MAIFILKIIMIISRELSSWLFLYKDIYKWAFNRMWKGDTYDYE